MRQNQGVRLAGGGVALVPYGAHHVAQYHGWMEDAWLREMTGSERLSLAEEHAMQQAWARDPDKCTFIVELDGAPVGDVNLFFHDAANEDRAHRYACAEIEVMVAEPAARRRGVASEALAIMMAYAVQDLGVGVFEAKVKDGNDASLRLFRGLGYVQVSHSAVFEETTLQLDVAPGSAGFARVVGSKRAVVVARSAVAS